jgi:hypothetical protein
MSGRKYSYYVIASECYSDMSYDDYQEAFCDHKKYQKQGISNTLYGVDSQGAYSVIMSC